MVLIIVLIIGIVMATFVAFALFALLSTKRPINERFINSPTKLKTRVALITVMYNPPDLPIWLRHHRMMGVERFYLRLEDTPMYVEYLSNAQDVSLEVGEKDHVGSNYFSLMDRQKRFVDQSIVAARQNGIDWVITIDSDELLKGSLAFLEDLPLQKSCLHMTNAEAVYSGDEESCFSSQRFRECSLQSKCRSYINGKSGGRAIDGVSQAGPHYFAYEGAINGPHLFEIPFDVLCVLHFDSCSFSSWSSKFMNLSAGSKDVAKTGEIPFQYYNESIDAASKAYEVYKKHTQCKGEGASCDDIITIEHFDETPVESEAVNISRMRVKCINIDAKTDRWDASRTSFEMSDLGKIQIIERHSATLGSRVNIEAGNDPQIVTSHARDELLLTEQRGFRTHHHQLTRGAIGCFISHWIVYQELMADEEHDVYLVLEDDSVVATTIANMIASLSLPANWDVLLLGSHRMQASAATAATADMLKVEGFWGTYGYMINKRGASKCVKEFERGLIDVQIDSKMSWMTRPHDGIDMLNMYATKTQWVITNPAFMNDTDIQMPIKETPDSYYYDGIKLIS